MTGRTAPARTARAVAALAGVLVLVAGCGDADRAPDIEPIEFTAPVPVSAVERPEIEPPSQQEDCNATASFRPDGPPPSPGDMPAGSTMAEIVRNGRLVVGVDQNSYLMGFRNSFTNELEGFDIDVAREIAKAVFGGDDDQVDKHIQFRVVTSAGREPALQEGLVDIVVRSMTINCDRWENIDFSAVYYQAGQRLLVQSDAGIDSVADLGGRRACATDGSTSLKNVVAEQPDVVPVAVPDWTDCLVMLQQGQVDAVTTDDTLLAGMAAQDPYLRVVGPKFSAEPYGVGVAKGSEDLVRFVNAVLDRMRSDGTWNRIHQKWLRDALGETAEPPTARYGR